MVNGSKAKFSASHFLKTPKRCSRLHGHNYYVSFEVKNSLNANDFVVDFIELTENLKTVVKTMDHYVLLPIHSKSFKIEKSHDSVEVTNGTKRYVFPLSDVCFLPIESTSAESLAKYIYDKLKDTYPSMSITIGIEESRSSSAFYGDDV